MAQEVPWGEAMRYLSVCSGIEAATVAWHPLGWTPVAFSEIEPFPSSVLAHHYPTVPNLGDMTKFKEWEHHDIDVLVGGTPCQSFSVAGLRKGLADPRGNLMLTYLAIADKYRPRWLVWENVPGVLSSNGGKDFGTFLGGLAELGYGFAFRVLDAQYFGVPQRRRRVFVVGCLGDWRSAAAVLFERDSVQRNPAPSRKTGQAVTGTISSRTSGGGGLGTDFEIGGGLQAVTFDRQSSGEYGIEPIASTVSARDYKGPSDLIATVPTLVSNGDAHSGFRDEHGLVPVSFNFHKSGNGASSLGIAKDRTDCLRADTKSPFAIAWTEEQTPSIDAAGTIQRGGAGGRHDGVMQPDMKVRRLTPIECERLQGFPDGYTLVPHRGKPAADGPRYKALGNSMAVPCMAWIGKRIDMVCGVMP